MEMRENGRWLIENQRQIADTSDLDILTETEGIIESTETETIHDT